MSSASQAEKTFPTVEIAGITFEWNGNRPNDMTWVGRVAANPQEIVRALATHFGVKYDEDNKKILVRVDNSNITIKASTYSRQYRFNAILVYANEVDNIDAHRNSVNLFKTLLQTASPRIDNLLELAAEVKAPASTINSARTASSHSSSASTASLSVVSSSSAQILTAVEERKADLPKASAATTVPSPQAQASSPSSVQGMDLLTDSDMKMTAMPLLDGSPFTTDCDAFYVEGMHTLGSSQPTFPVSASLFSGSLSSSSVTSSASALQLDPARSLSPVFFSSAMVGELPLAATKGYSEMEHNESESGDNSTDLTVGKDDASMLHGVTSTVSEVPIIGELHDTGDDEDNVGEKDNSLSITPESLSGSSEEGEEMLFKLD